ncbi:MAG: hypothetical protein WBC85_01975, partial [Planktotalea sp.]|uniref:hypothetical protein n=1 Tax=Planktotalea sp. TaxID=2029877 RepID=UPI003C741DAD
MLDQKEIEALFTRKDGRYSFARWGRAISPVVFGVTDETLKVVKGALEAVCLVANHHMAETDPELGSNAMFFFFTDWAELLEVPNLDKLVPDLAAMVARVSAGNANQYRVFRFDEDGAIKACFSFIRMDAALSDLPAETLALNQAVQMMVLWSDTAFLKASPLAAMPDGGVIVKPEISGLLAAAYDRVMPVAANDPSHALRLA